MASGHDDKDATSFDELMRQAGVKKLGAGDPAPGRGRRRGPRRKPGVDGAGARPRPAGKATTRPAGKATTRPIRPPPARSPGRPPAPTRVRGGGGDMASLFDEIERLRAKLEDAERRARLGAEATEQLAGERARAQDLRRERDRMGAELAHAHKALDAAQQQAADAADALQRATSIEGEGVVSLRALLRDRGILGPTEVMQVLAGMARERVLDELIDQLYAVDPQGVGATLRQRVQILGDCGVCPRLPGGVALHLTRDRCEVCRGGDLVRARRRFYDACLVNGLTRVLLVGGTPKDQRILRVLLDDRRVLVEPVHGGLRKAAADVADELAAARLLVIWEGAALEPAVAATYAAFTGPTVRVAEPDIAHMLEAAASAVFAIVTAEEEGVGGDPVGPGGGAGDPG